MTMLHEYWWKYLISTGIAGLMILSAQPCLANLALPVKSAVNPDEASMTYLLEAKLRIPSTAPTATPTPDPSKPLPFKVGETCLYTVDWGTINAGTVTTVVEDIIDYQGHQVYKVTVTAKSNRFFSVFFRVYDVLESLIDVRGLFSRRYWTRQEEGSYKAERLYEFDQERNTAYHKDKEYYIQYGIHDEVSAVYYVRTLDFQVGTPIYVDIFAKKQNWRVTCDVVAAETIEVSAGTFDTILVEPQLNFDGVMQKGRVQIWFSDDQYHIPVKVKTKIAVIGAITVNLAYFQPGTGTPATQIMTE